MEDQNQTAVTKFLFLGLTDDLYQQIVLLSFSSLSILPQWGVTGDDIDRSQIPHTYVLFS